MESQNLSLSMTWNAHFIHPTKQWNGKFRHSIPPGVFINKHHCKCTIRYTNHAECLSLFDQSLHYNSQLSSMTNTFVTKLFKKIEKCTFKSHISMIMKLTWPEM